MTGQVIGGFLLLLGAGAAILLSASGDGDDSKEDSE
jgi:hypothetical protein